ncbi:MAG TPA: hypothetical protein VN153_13395 [Tahibacter sp.]|nr:hypothetical protein [Tahibacter sp.]
MPRRSYLSALLLIIALPAPAALVCSPALNLPVPATSEGLYVNFSTGVSGTSESAVPGFDFDPYAAVSSTPSDQLRFYWGSATTGNAGVASSGDRYALLSAGSVVGPASLFTRAGFTGDTSAWTSELTTGYLGMRFLNEATSAINYGWVLLTTTPPLGFPMTIHGWCYDDTGAGIAIAPVSVSDPIFSDTFGG